MSKVTPDCLVWVDLETTGLSVENDVVLEVGLKVTDHFLKPLAAKSWLVCEQNWRTALKSAAYVVKDMHIKSGLISEIEALPDEWRVEGRLYRPTPERVAFEGWKWLTEDLGLEPNRYPMCGSTIFFDRVFITQRLPVLGAFFHYRNIDVSTLKELCKILNPDVAASWAKDPRSQKANATHRVLHDIDTSIAELQFYVDNFLFVENIDPDTFMGPQ